MLWARSILTLSMLLGATTWAASEEQERTPVAIEFNTAVRSVTVTPTATAVATSTPVPATATPVPTPTPTATPVPTRTPSCVEQLPLRVALGQLLLVLAGPEEFPNLAVLAEERQLSGVVVLGLLTATDLAGLTRQDGGGVPLLLASDEEGGGVQRLGALLGPLPTAKSLVARPLDEVETIFAAYGQGMGDLGFSVAFAPVVDVGSGPGIEERSFSSDPEVVTAYGRAVIDGYLGAAVVPVLKHFPGHGRATADSHDGSASTPHLDELRASDLVPFVQLISNDVAVMVGHLLVPGLTAGVPASLSPEAIDGLLRGELGFDGLVVTDDLGMGAVSRRWDSAEAALLALVAGADLVMLQGPDQVLAVLDYVEASVADGSLSRAQVDDSVERVLATKSVDPCLALGLES